MKNKARKKGEENEIRDQYTVVLEDIKSQMSGVAEGVITANQKMDRGFEEMGSKISVLNQKVDLGFKDIYKELNKTNEKVDRGFEKVDKRFNEVDKKFEEVNENMKLMRTEIGLIRHNQITKDESQST